MALSLLLQQVLICLKLTDWSRSHVYPGPDFLFHLPKDVGSVCLDHLLGTWGHSIRCWHALKWGTVRKSKALTLVSSLRLGYAESQARCWWPWAHSWHTLSFSPRMGRQPSTRQCSVGILKQSRCSWKQGRTQPWETRYWPFPPYLLTPLGTCAEIRRFLPKPRITHPVPPGQICVTCKGPLAILTQAHSLWAADLRIWLDADGPSKGTVKESKALTGVSSLRPPPPSLLFVPGHRESMWGCW